jgi:hypothetical protein
VPNWSISRNYKEILNFTKIILIPGVYLTRGGSVQRPLTSGPRGWSAGETQWPAGPTLQPLTGWLRGDTLQEAVERNPKLKVGGGRTPWPADNVTRPAGYHLACSLDPYKYPLPVEIKATHSICSSPIVKVWFSSSSTNEALSGAKSRVKHSLKLRK